MVTPSTSTWYHSVPVRDGDRAHMSHGVEPASNGAKPRNPDWYANLIATPGATGPGHKPTDDEHTDLADARRRCPDLDTAARPHPRVRRPGPPPRHRAAPRRLDRPRPPHRKPRDPRLRHRSCRRPRRRRRRPHPTSSTPPRLSPPGRYSSPITPSSSRRRVVWLAPETGPPQIRDRTAVATPSGAPEPAPPDS